MPALTTAQIAAVCGGTLEGDSERVITGANTPDQAGPAELAFAAQGPWTLIRVSEPRVAFARALTALYGKPRPQASIDPTARIDPSARVGPDCVIGAYVTIGAHSEIGRACSIGAGCHIGEEVYIGENSMLHAGVTVYDRVRIGARVVLHSGCVIGADGFGFTLTADRYEKFPQVGTVEIGDDVEIGANSCVDRAALGATRIGEGTKIDNLVHIAHNCSIGKHVVIAAQTGFSGSVTVGDYAVIGGQVGVGEKAQIEAKAVVGGKAGILVSQRVRAGEPVWGIPARPLRQHLKNLAQLNRLGELRQEIEALKRKS